MTDVPPGFSRHERDGAALWLADGVAEALLAAGVADPPSLREAAHAHFQGRGRPFAVTVGGVGAVFVRPYLRGGALRHVNPDRYTGSGRFQAELAAMVSARAAGVPVCEPLGVVSRPAGLGFRRGWLLLREVPGAMDLRTFLAGLPEPSPARRRQVLARAGSAVRRLHDQGFEHPDLHLGNLLLTGDDRVLVLDLDRARLHPDLSRRRRLAGLFRMDRYAAKQAALGHPVTRVDRMRMLRSYAGADWPPREELRALAGALAAHVARHARATAPATAPGVEAAG